MQLVFAYIVFLWNTYYCGVNAIIGYDCGTSSQLNVTTLSLLDVEECNIPLTNPRVDKIYIQLLQLSKFEMVPVTQCKVSISRFIHHCGMHSHVSTVINAQAEYVLDITRDQCRTMHETGMFSITATTFIHGLKINQTTFRPVTLAGSATSDGNCAGAQYSDPYGTWNNVVVQGTVAITLTSYYTAVDLESDHIRLRSGTICPYTKSTCMDIDGGQTFWQTLPTDYCRFSYYDVLYEGYANMINDTLDGESQIVYSLSTKDITFALTKTGHEELCGYHLIKTEHPKLLILETTKGKSFATQHRISNENLDIFAYINSKFVYVEKHIRTQMNSLYRDVLQQRCTLEQQVLKNALSLAINSPDEFAYQIMKGPGYMAVISGEVVHIIKCTPIDVKIQHVKECYSELPVQRGNKTFFLSPRTHLLIKTGTQVSCNRIIPPMYFLHDGWYCMIPTPERTLPPTIIKPITKPTWHYINPGSLATSGIYSTKDLENLRDHIMFSAERGGILNTMARGAAGEPTIAQGISLLHLLDDDTIQKITENTWNRVWGKFTAFGNASAGIIGIYFCIRVVKLIIDTIIHGYAIHTIYGWSLHLLGAFWDSITNLLLHLSRKPQETTIHTQPPSEEIKQLDQPHLTSPQISESVVITPTALDSQLVTQLTSPQNSEYVVTTPTPALYPQL